MNKHLSLTLPLVLLMFSLLITTVFASGYNLTQVVLGLKQGLQFTRPTWEQGTYIKMPYVSDWVKANTDIYIYSTEHPEGIFWQPTDADRIAKDYMEVTK